MHSRGLPVSQTVTEVYNSFGSKAQRPRFLIDQLGRGSQSTWAGSVVLHKTILQSTKRCLEMRFLKVRGLENHGTINSYTSFETNMAQKLSPSEAEAKREVSPSPRRLEGGRQLCEDMFPFHSFLWAEEQPSGWLPCSLMGMHGPWCHLPGPGQSLQGSSVLLGPNFSAHRSGAATAPAIHIPHPGLRQSLNSGCPFVPISQPDTSASAICVSGGADGPVLVTAVW